MNLVCDYLLAHAAFDVFPQKTHSSFGCLNQLIFMVYFIQETTAPSFPEKGTDICYRAGLS